MFVTWKTCVWLANASLQGPHGFVEGKELFGLRISWSFQKARTTTETGFDEIAGRSLGRPGLLRQGLKR